jgi:hypothetical protein
MFRTGSGCLGPDPDPDPVPDLDPRHIFILFVLKGFMNAKKLHVFVNFYYINKV